MAENDEGLSPEQKLKRQRETVELQKKEAEAAREVQAVAEQIEDLQRKRNEEAAGLIDSAKFELEYQTLIAKGEYDKAEALKLEYDLKQKNLKLTDEEKKALSDTLKQRKELSFAQTLSEKARALDRSIAPQDRDGTVDNALADAAKTKGGALTSDEADLVRRLAGAEFDMRNSQKTFDYADIGRQIKTNSLTARGGFVGGAVVTDEVNFKQGVKAGVGQIADAVKAIVRDTSAIAKKGDTLL